MDKITPNSWRAFVVRAALRLVGALPVLNATDGKDEDSVAFDVTYDLLPLAARQHVNYAMFKALAASRLPFDDTTVTAMSRAFHNYLNGYHSDARDLSDRPERHLHS